MARAEVALCFVRFEEALSHQLRVPVQVVLERQKDRALWLSVDGVDALGGATMGSDRIGERVQELMDIRLHEAPRSEGVGLGFGLIEDETQFFHRDSASPV